MDKALSELFQRQEDVFPIVVHTARLKVDVLLSELRKEYVVHELTSQTIAVALLEGDIDVPAP